jgi:3-hydroxyanthranilate 3,4-dioxygenase
MFDKYSPINFHKWIDENRHLLKPPVGNKVIWQNRDFIVMVVGGPNQRTDYHYNEGEEFFFQIEGTINLKVVDDQGQFRDVHIAPGEVYLLPPKTPHSPQRPSGSVGLVIEHKRTAEQKDGFLWYCKSCGHKLYEEYFALTNIETQFPAIFNRFYGSDFTKCKNCGTVMVKPVEKSIEHN